MPALIQDGYTSFKVYMTYELLKIDDRQLLDILARRRANNPILVGPAGVGKTHLACAWAAEIGATFAAVPAEGGEEAIIAAVALALMFACSDDTASPTTSGQKCTDGHNT